MTEKGQEKKLTLQVVREYAEVLIIALALALFIRTFIIQAFKIPSGSKTNGEQYSHFGS